MDSPENTQTDPIPPGYAQKAVKDLEEDFKKRLTQARRSDQNESVANRKSSQGGKLSDKIRAVSRWLNPFSWVDDIDDEINDGSNRVQENTSSK